MKKTQHIVTLVVTTTAPTTTAEVAENLADFATHRDNEMGTPFMFRSITPKARVTAGQDTAGQRREITSIGYTEADGFFVRTRTQAERLARNQFEKRMGLYASWADAGEKLTGDELSNVLGAHLHTSGDRPELDADGDHELGTTGRDYGKPRPFFQPAVKEAKRRAIFQTIPSLRMRWHSWPHDVPKPDVTVTNGQYYEREDGQIVGPSGYWAAMGCWLVAGIRYNTDGTLHSSEPHQHHDDVTLTQEVDKP